MSKTANNSSKNIRRKEDEFTILKRMLSDCSPRRCENDMTLITVPFGNGTHQFAVGSGDFNDYLICEFIKITGKRPKQINIKTMESYLRNEALLNKPKEMNYRIKQIGDVIYYDLCNDSHQYVVITKGDVVIKSGELNFMSYSTNQVEQVTPVLDRGDINRLRKYINIPDEDWVLFLCYLISCFVEGVHHPILNINGVWGSGKSTVSKVIKSIIDPTQELLTDLPQKKDDLIVTLASSYYTCFDNISKLNQETSDCMCKCVYGGNASYRQFYCQNVLINVPYHSLILLNGISDFIVKGDLADRTIYMETLPIEDSNRKTETEFWNEFNKDKPYILGGIFNILSKAMALYDTIQITKLHRLSDFHKWGCAIAKAIDLEWENIFANSLNRNKANQISNTLDNNTMLSALFDYIEKYEDGAYKSTISKLFRDVKEFIQDDYSNKYDIKYFPKAANSFGKKLKGYTQLCKELGWNVNIYKSGNSYVEITRIEDKNENTPTDVIVRKPIYFIRTPIITRKPILTNKNARVVYTSKEYKSNLV